MLREEDTASLRDSAGVHEGNQRFKSKASSGGYER